MLPNALLCSRKPQFEDCPEDVISCDSMSLYKWHIRRQHRNPPKGKKRPASDTCFEQQLARHRLEPDLDFRHFSPILLIDHCLTLIGIRIPVLWPLKRSLSDGEKPPSKRLQKVLPCPVGDVRGVKSFLFKLEILHNHNEAITDSRII
jgi:hypothetical protein